MTAPTSPSNIDIPAIDMVAERSSRSLPGTPAKEHRGASTALSAEEGNIPSQVLIRAEPDEAEAIRLLICAETVPMWLSFFLKSVIPYSVVLSMIVAPAWPLPSQVVFGWFSLGYLVGKFLVAPYKNPWLKYNFFMAPLMLAGLTRFGEVVGRVVFCQVAFKGDLVHIEQISSTSAFVRNECNGYPGGISHYQLGFLIWEASSLLIMAFDLLTSGLHSREKVSNPLARYKDRVYRVAQRVGEAQNN